MVSAQAENAGRALIAGWPFAGRAVSLRWLDLWRAVQIDDVIAVWREIPSCVGHQSGVQREMPLC